MNKKIAAGVIAGLIAGAGAGVALGVPGMASSQESPSTTEAPAPSTDGATTPAPSTDGATTPPRPERGQWVQDALAPLVTDGTITQGQADAVIAALDAAKPERGPGGPGRGFGRGLDTAAEAIGVTADELRQAVQGGQTIAAFAQSKGVDPQAVVDAMVANLKTHLDEEVAAGEHTQAEADAKLAGAQDAITAMINGEAPAGGRGFGGPGMGRHGHGGMDDDGSADDSSTGTSA
jgi:hypothetical protein